MTGYTGLPELIAISGPDGSGKSSLARSLSDREGRRALQVHLYGCFACRRWSGRRLHPPAPAPPSAGRRAIQAARAAHGLVDALEMSLRLAAVVTRAVVTRRDLVITDRGPLDALAKHDPHERSLAGRWYLWLARRYRVNFLLDAEAATLARRDGEHSATELERARALFDRWAESLSNCVRIRTDRPLAAASARGREVRCDRERS